MEERHPLIRLQQKNVRKKRLFQHRQELDMNLLDGDNLNHGKESVLIDMNRASKKINNSEYTINALVYGNWYGERKSGNVTVEVSAYIGGYMEKDGFDFVNIEGKTVFKDSIKINVRNSGENNYLNIKQLYKKIAEVVYNKKDKDCVIFLLPEY